VDSPVIIDSDDPHVLAGWWAAATGFRRRQLDHAVIALGADGGTPSLGFPRAAPSETVRIALVADDIDGLVKRLLDLGGTRLESPPGNRGIADPAGNIAEVTPLHANGAARH
jgi:hypothetical protein